MNKLQLKDICRNIDIKTKIKASFAANPYLKVDSLDICLKNRGIYFYIYYNTIKKIKYVLLNTCDIKYGIFKEFMKN